MAKIFLKKQPTMQIFTSTQYTFTVTGGSTANVGALYTVNGQSFTVSVGAGGTAGTAGTSGAAGGAGGSGVVIVEEYYD